MEHHRQYTEPFDSLTEFHLHHIHHGIPVDAMLEIQELLQQPKEKNLAVRSYRIRTALEQDDNAVSIFNAICQKAHLDAEEVLHSFGKYPFSSPALILHFWFLTGLTDSITKIADQLEIDLWWAKQLLSHLKSIFTIDNPLIWLLNFHLSAEKEKRLCVECKSKLLYGQLQVAQPEDTCEERRLKVRNNLGTNSIFRRD